MQVKMVIQCNVIQRSNFVRQADTTGKTEITEGTRKEAELTFLHQIVQYIEVLLILP